MKRTNEDFSWIRREYDNLETKWDSYTYYELKKTIERTFKFIKEKKDVFNCSVDISNFMYEYGTKLANLQKEVWDEIHFGYTYALDELEEYISNPESIWELYDNYEKKEELFSMPYLRYTTDKKENHTMFLKDMLLGVLKRNNLTLETVKNISAETKKQLAQMHAEEYKKRAKQVWEKWHKEMYINGIRKEIETLELLNGLDQNRKKHNENMKKVELECLQVDNDVPNIDKDGNILGVDLEKCTIFQLEALLSFWSNRVEKVKEEIGMGLFIINELGRMNQSKQSYSEVLTEENIKKAWKNYQIISKICNLENEKMHKEKIAKKNGSVELIDGKIVYVEHYRKYESVYCGLPGNKDVHWEETMCAFSNVNSNFREMEYLKKTRLIEDIIIQSARQKINWGVMEERGEIKLRKMVLIGVDVPGFNMPLRLHYPLEELKKVMKDYLGLEEVPLYIGSKDFYINERNVGTQLLFPITSKQSDAIKKIAKSKNKRTKDTDNWIKHIACMQLPNMVKKLLDYKTQRTQEYPDYINIFTRKIRRTPRKNIPNPNDDNR